ncbi:MAG: hypothetical protein AAF548_07635 [Actinomycetota bacterium]
MLLGQSSDAIEQDADLAAVVGDADAGIPAATELRSFAEAAWRRDDGLAPAREALRAIVGDAGVIEAAQTVAVFRSLNIAADSSGIPLDDGWRDVAAGFVSTLGLDAFPTAANTPGY